MPPLLERGYRAAAITELERAVREIEERDKKAQKKNDFEAAEQSIISNLTFAERLNLISAQQADAYKERVEKAMQDFERQRLEEEHNKALNGDRSTNSRAGRQLTMDEAQAEIARMRAEEEPHNQSENGQVYAAPSRGEDDGTKTH